MSRLLSLAACSLIFTGSALATAEPGPVTTSLDLRLLSEAAYQKLDGVALERRVMMRLVQEGFAVVSLEVGGQVRLRLRENGPSTLILTVTDPSGERSRTIARGDESTAELHLELAQKAAELARPALVRWRVATNKAKPDGDKQVGGGSPTPLHVDGQAGAALLYRGAATDPLFWSDLRIDVHGGLGVHLSLGVAPANSGPVTATDIQLQAGLGYRHALHPRVDVEAALLVGTVLQRWSIAAAGVLAGGDTSGTRVNVIASLPLSVDWWILPHVALCARVAAGVADAGGTQVIAGATVWQRDVFRLEGGLAVKVRFR